MLEAMRARPRPPRGSKPAACTGHMRRRKSDALDNCVVSHLEVCTLGYTGS